MRAWVCAGRWGGAVAVVAMLSGCEQPDWLTRRDPLPAMPAWAEPLIGRPFAAAFAATPDCLGNVDEVINRYGGERPGAKVQGWAWDARSKAPFGRIVVVADDGVIVGAGESGLERADVPTARPEVGSNLTGWWALAARGEGLVEAWGVRPDGRTACRLGRIKL